MNNRNDIIVYKNIIVKAMEINSDKNLSEDKKKLALIEYTKSLYKQKGE